MRDPPKFEEKGDRLLRKINPLVCMQKCIFVASESGHCCHNISRDIAFRNSLIGLASQLCRHDEFGSVPFSRCFCPLLGISPTTSIVPLIALIGTVAQGPRYFKYPDRWLFRQGSTPGRDPSFFPSVPLLTSPFLSNVPPSSSSSRWRNPILWVHNMGCPLSTGARTRGDCPPTSYLSRKLNWNWNRLCTRVSLGTTYGGQRK